MESPTDAELISRSLAEPGIFGGIFDRHAEALLRFLTRRAGPEAAGSLLGELFRVAFERRSAFDPERESAKPWLYGIGANLLLHRARGEGRRGRATRAIEELSLTEGSARREEPRMLEEIDARLLLPRVAAALGSLPDTEREALLLHAWEGLAYHDVAEALNIPTGTVRSRIHRGRARLRELIGLGGKDSLNPKQDRSTAERDRRTEEGG